MTGIKKHRSVYDRKWEKKHICGNRNRDSNQYGDWPVVDILILDGDGLIKPHIFMVTQDVCAF